jgi:putative transposase
MSTPLIRHTNRLYGIVNLRKRGNYVVSTRKSRYRRHRFPIEVVEQCVWLYFRFALRYRNIEEMMAKRGVLVTYETVREWCHKFGSAYAARPKKKRARFGAKWHLDEVFIKMNGIQHYLWRAVDQNGAVIDIRVQPRRDRWAALRFFRKYSIRQREHRASSSRTSYGAMLQRRS